MDETAQEGARGEQHVIGEKFLAELGAHADDFAVFRKNVGNHVLPDGEAFLREHVALDRGKIGFAVYLGAAGAHGRALAGVQNAELNAGFVGPFAHAAAEGVDFAHQMPLGQTADGGIAGKMTDAVHVAGDDEHVVAQTGERHGRFTAGVSGPDDDAGIMCHGDKKSGG